MLCATSTGNSMIAAAGRFARRCSGIGTMSQRGTIHSLARRTQLAPLREHRAEPGPRVVVLVLTAELAQAIAPAVNGDYCGDAFIDPGRVNRNGCAVALPTHRNASRIDLRLCRKPR